MNLFSSYQIRLVVFDLDGVLCDSRWIHFKAFNEAVRKVQPECVLTHEEHESRYDGRSTTTKLNMLTKEKGLDPANHGEVWRLKQEMTFDIIDNEVTEDIRLQEIMKTLKSRGYFIYCASNAIYKTVQMILLRKGVLPYFDFICSNEDVNNPKPHPEIYMKCCCRAKVLPCEVMIVEDSPIGRRAALSSGCHLCPVSDPSDVTLERILQHILEAEGYQHRTNPFQTHIPWIQRSHLNVVFPLLRRKGEDITKTPAYLEMMHDRPMIEWVIDNLNFTAKYIFIIPKEDEKQHFISHTLCKIAPNSEVIFAESETEGAACTVLLAKSRIDNDDPLIIANGDQYLEWEGNHFMYVMQNPNLAGGVVTYPKSKSNRPVHEYSYVSIEANGFVDELTEKEDVSDHAIAGVFFWRHGQDYVRSAERMIASQKKVNGAYYVALAFNELLAEGAKIAPYEVKGVYKLRTRDDIARFVSRNFLPESMEPFHCTRLISEGGNLIGPESDREHSPDLLVEVLENNPGLELCINLWTREDDCTLLSGNAHRKYDMDPEILRKYRTRLWVRCNNTHALAYCLRNGLHCFSCAVGSATLTSKGYIWQESPALLIASDVTILCKPESHPSNNIQTLTSATKICTSYIHQFLKGRPAI